MTAVASKCPECSEPMEVDDSREFMFCQYCGSKVNVEEVTGKRFDRLSKADELVTEAFDEWKDGNEDSAMSHILEALRDDPENPRGWILRSVIDDAIIREHTPGMKINESDRAFMASLLSRDPRSVFAILRVFPDDPDYRLLGELITIIDGARQAANAGTIYIDETNLEKGWDDHWANKSKETDRALKIIEFLRSNDTKIGTFESGADIVKELGDMRSIFQHMRENVLTMQPITLLSEDGSPFKPILHPKHLKNGEAQKIKADRNDSAYHLEPGKHEFIGKRTTTVLIPRMPAAAFEDARIQLNGGIYRRFALKDHPGWSVEVRPTME